MSYTEQERVLTFAFNGFTHQIHPEEARVYAVVENFQAFIDSYRTGEV